MPFVPPHLEWVVEAWRFLAPRAGGFGSAVPLDQVGYYCRLVGIEHHNIVLRLAGYLDAMQRAANEYMEEEREREKEMEEAKQAADRVARVGR